MAENPYVNKVVFGNDTLVDLTEDSVTENTLLEGETAHNAAGAPITGTAKQGHIIWNAIKTALSPQRLKLWFADAKVTDDSTEQATKVEVVQLIDDESELTNAPDGVYQGDYDDALEDILDASMVAYGEGSVEDALDAKANKSWTKVAYSTPQTLTQGAFTQVSLSATPNLANYSEVMLLLRDKYTSGSSVSESVDASVIMPVGIATNLIASYAYPTSEGYYTRAQLQFGYNKTTISKAYMQDGGNHTANNQYYVEVYAR